MTCIAYRNGIMAADSQMTLGDESKVSVKKITRLGDGSLFACAGSQRPISKLKAWAAEGFEESKKPRVGVKADIEALLVKPDGSIWYYDWTLEPDKLEDAFYAIGSGGAYARAAMACGRSAVQAVKIAARFDSRTSEPVEKMELKV